MDRIVAVIEPPYVSGHLARLSELTALGGVEVKARWQAGEPVFDNVRHFEDAAEAGAVLDALLAYAGEKDLKVTLYGVDDRRDEKEILTPEEAKEVIGDAAERQVEHDPPTVDEIARRALCLVVMHVHGMGNRARAAELVEAYGVAADLSSSERAYLADPEPDEYLDIVATWRIEAAAVMLAAIGLMPLGPVTQTSDVGAMIGVVQGHTGITLAAAATEPDDGVTESRPEIEEMHWAVRDARINGRPDPEGFNPSVVVERHRAMAWLDDGGPWDKVDTST